MPAERTDDFWLLAVDDGDVIAKMMKQSGVVATIQKEAFAAENTQKDVSKKLRFAVLSFLFLGHVVLQKHEAPAGTNTDRGSEFVICGLLGNFNRK